ncbi:hypothetical protein JST97_36720 [bacterium]|nr:hypothetical protein [bacterium]
MRERELSDAGKPGPEIPLADPIYRRLTVYFVSGHRYVVDLGKSFFDHHGVDIQDSAASEKLLESRLNNAEVFRRSIRDFSKQLPVVYEYGALGHKGMPVLVGHQAPAKRESAWETRILPEGLL